MNYLHETKLAMLIDADAVPVAHHRPYRDIDIRYPWKSDEQRAAEVVTEILPFKTEAVIDKLRDLSDAYRAAVDRAMGVSVARMALERARIDAAERSIHPVTVIVEGPSSPPDFHINAELRVAEDGFISQQAKLAAERLARIAESRRKDGRFSALDDGVGQGEFRGC